MQHLQQLFYLNLYMWHTEEQHCAQLRETEMGHDPEQDACLKIRLDIWGVNIQVETGCDAAVRQSTGPNFLERDLLLFQWCHPSRLSHIASLWSTAEQDIRESLKQPRTHGQENPWRRHVAVHMDKQRKRSALNHTQGFTLWLHDTAMSFILLSR